MAIPVNFRSGKFALFQSAVHNVIQSKGGPTSTLAADHPMMQQAATVLAAAEQGDSLDKFADTEFECASLAVQAGLAAIDGDKTKQAEIEAQLRDSSCDPGWITTIAVYLGYYTDGQQPQYTNWTSIDDFVYPMPDPEDRPLTVGILADWGTGDPAIAKVSLEGLLSKKPDLIIHLGDIYYAGTSDETHENFLKWIDRAREEYPVPVWNMPAITITTAAAVLFTIC